VAHPRLKPVPAAADDRRVTSAAPAAAGPRARPAALLPAAHPHARLLVVDDEQPNLDLMGRVLARAGYLDVVLMSEPELAVQAVQTLRPDLVLLDLHMPGLDGFAFLRRLQDLVPASELLPRLMITADATEATRRSALALGAHDFLTKPIDVMETTLRVANLLQTRMLHVQLREHNGRLEDQVRERTRQLTDSHREITRRLALVGEYSDDDTAQHTVRVGLWAERLAQELGFAPAAAQLLGEAAPLHDIGKVAIPDAVLLKRGRLLPEEFEVIKTHTTIGAHILANGDSDLLRLAEQVALTHHERWDGTGYPARLAGAAIPLAGRVVSVVDVFDALTNARPYKHAWPVDRAVAEMTGLRGRHFDPEVLDVFLGLVDGD
jgi:putative two-component system response regulator